MNQETLVPTASRARVTWMMILCGLMGASAAGAAGAAPPDEPLSLSLRYRQESLATDEGAKAFFHRLEKAAAEVCPTSSVDSYHPSLAVAQCRQQSIARAVQQINNPRLAAVYSMTAKRG
jgi:UrcA family protein